MTAVLCSSCELDNDRAPQRYCSGCHMVYMRAWRDKQRVSRETIVPNRVPEMTERAET